MAKKARWRVVISKFKSSEISVCVFRMKNRVGRDSQPVANFVFFGIAM
jgi:hypothetical protein